MSWYVQSYERGVLWLGNTQTAETKRLEVDGVYTLEKIEEADTKGWIYFLKGGGYVITEEVHQGYTPKEKVLQIHELWGSDKIELWDEG